jgi:hypothetical protein
MSYLFFDTMKSFFNNTIIEGLSKKEREKNKRIQKRETAKTARVNKREREKRKRIERRGREKRAPRREREKREREKREREKRQRERDRIERENLKKLLADKNRDLAIKNSEITRLKFEINDKSNSNQFYKDQINGSNNQPGFLNILTKQKEKFSNINNIEEMNTMEGFNVSQKQLNDVVKENKLLESQIQQNKNNYTADDSQVFYKQQQFFRQKDFNGKLYIIFYVLVLLLLMYLIFINVNTNIYLKIFIIIILAIYPFIIEYVEFLMYFIFYYIYSLVNGSNFKIDSYTMYSFGNT